MCYNLCFVFNHAFLIKIIILQLLYMWVFNKIDTLAILSQQYPKKKTNWVKQKIENIYLVKRYFFNTNILCLNLSICFEMTQENMLILKFMTASKI